MYRTMFLTVLMLWGAICSAATIVGKICDINGNPLQGTDITISGTKIGTASKSDGTFALEDVGIGKQKILIAHTAFKSVVHKVTISSDDEIHNIGVVSFTKYSVIDADEVVVSAMRRESFFAKTPEVMQVIGKQQIEEHNPNSMAEVLALVSGIAVNTGTGSGLPKRSAIGVNGFPPNYCVVLVNGRRLLSEHIHTGQNTELVPMANVERIEVIKGAASAQYGSDALGGIVNILTKGTVSQPHYDMFVNGGSYGTYAFGATSRAPIGNNAEATNFIALEQSDGVPLTAPAHRIGFMRYSQLNSMNSFSYRCCKNTTLKLNFDYARTTTLSSGVDAYSWLLMPAVSIETKPLSTVILNISTDYAKWHSDVSAEEQTELTPSLNITWATSERNTFAIGGDYTQSSFSRTATPEHERYSAGLFVQNAYKITTNLDAMASLRLDKTENIDAVISPKLSLIFVPLQLLTVRAAAGRGFHAPSLMELYEEGYGHGGTAYRFGNPELNPEYSTTFDLGIELFPVENLELVAYGYYNLLDDLIVPVFSGPWEADTTINKWVRTNITSAKIMGYELSARYNFTFGLACEAGWTQIHNENNDNSLQLPYYPGSAFYGKLSYLQRVTRNFNIDVFASMHAVFDRSAWNWKPASGTEPDNPDGLTTDLADNQMLNAGISCAFASHMKIFFNATNLLAQDIENLDDAYTVQKGEVCYRAGINFSFE